MLKGHDHHWVTPRIALGSAVVNGEHVQALIADGITHVLDCRLAEGGEKLYEGTTIRYLANPTADDGKPKPEEWFKKGIGFVLTALAIPKSKVLVHCMLGVSRSPSMTYAVLRALGHAPDDAVKLIRKARILAGVRYREDADRAIAAIEQKRSAALRGVPKRR
ncbi:MAG TPA: dual specificity protein phosphatase [Polyangium sp.]|nr:dual specificity protein phosphatase [Polyangium sp.]